MSLVYVLCLYFKISIYYFKCKQMLTKFLREAFLGLNLCGFVIPQRVCKFSATRQPREAIFRVNL